MNNVSLGFAICGSFCTISSALQEIKTLKTIVKDIYPIISPIVATENTRFTNSEALKKELEEITGHKPIETITEAEPIGPKKPFDLLVVCPCTGNTLAKIANGITDTSVTMAVKAHIRNNKPVVIAVATNDALGASAKNIGSLLYMKNFYFVPLKQDDPIKKERSIVADFNMLIPTIEAATKQRQLTPIIK